MRYSRKVAVALLPFLGMVTNIQGINADDTILTRSDGIEHGDDDITWDTIISE